jgi:hypothetical protein
MIYLWQGEHSPCRILKELVDIYFENGEVNDEDEEIYPEIAVKDGTT